MKIAVVTDTSSLLEKEYLKKDFVYQLDLPISFENGEVLTHFENEEELRRFYDRLETEEMPKTSQPPMQQILDLMEELKEKNYDLVYFILITEGLSSTIQTVLSLAKDYENDFESVVINHHAAAYGISVLVHEAVDLIENSTLSSQEITDRLLDLQQNLGFYATITDFDHLVKGGRASAFSGAIGRLLSLVLILQMTQDGRLDLVEKVRTQKKGLKRILDYIGEWTKAQKNGADYLVMQADNLEHAEEVQQKLQEIYPDSSVRIVWFSPVIAVHTGKGAVCVVGIPRRGK